MSSWGSCPGPCTHEEPPPVLRGQRRLRAGRPTRSPHLLSTNALSEARGSRGPDHGRPGESPEAMAPAPGALELGTAPFRPRGNASQAGDREWLLPALSSDRSSGRPLGHRTRLTEKQMPTPWTHRQGAAHHPGREGRAPEGDALPGVSAASAPRARGSGVGGPPGPAGTRGPTGSGRAATRAPGSQRGQAGQPRGQTLGGAQGFPVGLGRRGDCEGTS